MRVKAKLLDGVTMVRLMAKHPMENGRRKDNQTGALIPAKFIQEINCLHKGKQVFIAYFGTAVSKNPYLAFSFSGGEKGETLVLRWIDNTGETMVVETDIR